MTGRQARTARYPKIKNTHSENFERKYHWGMTTSKKPYRISAEVQEQILKRIKEEGVVKLT
jgi:hypothetical protein